MARLVDTSIVNPGSFNLVPDIAPAANLIGQALQQRQQNQREDQKFQQLQQAQKIKAASKVAGDQMMRVRGIGDFNTQRKEMAILAQNAIQRGENPEIYSDALNITNPDELNLYLTRMATAMGNAVKEVDKFIPITDEAGNIIAQKDVRTGKAITDPRAVRSPDGVSSSQVQSSEFLPGGGARIVRKDGSVEVVQPSEEEKAIIRSAENRGVDLQQQRAKGRGLGAGAAKVANNALDQTDKIRTNNSKLRRVIAEVRGGAETGPLADMLPSFRTSTKRLIQLKNELGLDVVGSVTFGALSEGELNLAMDTALPTGLQGPELIKWAKDKISAQEKLAEYLEDQAIFLSKAGNTAADWLQEGRNKKAIRDQQSQSAPSSASRFTIEVVE